MRPDHGQLAGVALAAIMPANFYKALLPDDLDAIVAYLRTVKPVRNEVPTPSTSRRCIAIRYPDAEAGFSKAMFTDPVKRGAYLVTIGHCMECHSAWSRGVSDFKTGLGRGGRMFRRLRADGTPGATAANITSDPTSRHRRLDRSEIGRAITHGMAATGGRSSRRWRTTFYAGLKPTDVADIIAYLRTVPPLQ